MVATGCLLVHLFVCESCVGWAFALLATEQGVCDALYSFQSSATEKHVMGVGLAALVARAINLRMAIANHDLRW